MNYFALLGTFTDICREEFNLIPHKNLVVKNGVAFFQLQYGNQELELMISKLSGIIKRGEVATEDTLYTYFNNAVLLGSNSEMLAKFVKSSGRVRRRKLVKDIRSSDLELKKTGSVEVLELDQKFCVVKGYQDIAHYEQIDFRKPVSGMEIGMMPSKLAQMMVNIGVVARNKNQERTYKIENSSESLTIYDPFCGFGTTGFVVNRLGYNFIGSDINITPCKENVKRWKQGIGQKFDRFFTVFKHDVLESLKSRKMLDRVDVIVTEGRLGPVVRNFQSRDTRKPELMQKVLQVYTGFLKNYIQRFQGRKVPIVMTIPVYQIDGSSIQPDLEKVSEELGLSFSVIPQDYVRKGQNVGRRICVIGFIS